MAGIQRSAFLTGGTGFLGFNLASELVRSGWEVTALVRDRSKGDRLQKLGVKLALGSLLDLDSLREALPGDATGVFHVAGNTSLWSAHADEQFQDNVIGTRNMVEAALERHAARFVLTSSISAFGHHEDRIDEETASNALSSPINYHRTKWLAEEEVRRAIERGLDAVILNPCHIVGPHDYSNWSRMIRMVHDGSLPGVPPGSGVWCHVTEVARAHLSAIDRGKRGENYILGGEEASFLDAVAIIGELTGKRVPRNPTPSWVLRLVARLNQIRSHFTHREPDLTPEGARVVCERLRVDGSKAVDQLGYRSVPLRDMLTDCHSWMIQEGMLP